ncbi:hypothetical protein ABBQ38_002067 [Trebouxia sp. C0009 RCD-2024]
MSCDVSKPLRHTLFRRCAPGVLWALRNLPRKWSDPDIISFAQESDEFQNAVSVVHGDAHPSLAHDYRHQLSEIAAKCCACLEAALGFVYRIKVQQLLFWQSRLHPQGTTVIHNPQDPGEYHITSARGPVHACA